MSENLRAGVEFLNGNFELAAKMYHDAARNGDILASFNYGYCLWRGIGVKKDVREAKSYFAFARDMEGGESCYNLAIIYMQGDEMPRNYEKCFEYMRMSASKGCIEAQLYLGMAYTTGCIFEPDVIGIKMIPTHTPEYRSDVFMLEGAIPEFDEEDEELRYKAVKQDEHSAFECFQAAARHDPTNVEELSAKGKFLYAKCYVDGLGVEFDRMKSNRLMLLAGKAGSADALKYIAENGIIQEISAQKEQLLKSGR